jgi:hypothetical protein
MNFYKMILPTDYLHVKFKLKSSKNWSHTIDPPTVPFKLKEYSYLSLLYTVSACCIICTGICPRSLTVFSILFSMEGWSGTGKTEEFGICFCIFRNAFILVSTRFHSESYVFVYASVATAIPAENGTILPRIPIAFYITKLFFGSARELWIFCGRVKKKNLQ